MGSVARGAPFIPMSIVSMIYLFRHAGEHRQLPVKMKHETHTTATETTSCPGGAREQRLNLVIHKHKHTHTPIQSPSPHMGLKTIGLAPAPPRLLPSELTAPDSALAALPRTATKPGMK